MQRPLAVLAAAACGLLLLSVVANLIAIQKSDPPQTPHATRTSVVDRGSSSASTSRLHPSAPADPSEVVEQAQALATRLLGENALGPLGDGGPLSYTAQTRVLMESKASGRWVTLTEVRASCADVDRALARVADLTLGRPDRCERWIETTAAVLESHGVSKPSAREFLTEHEVETSVRVLLIYAGWHTDPENGKTIVLASSGAAPVYPRDGFMAARTAALDTIYRTLRLGPYSEG